MLLPIRPRRSISIVGRTRGAFHAVSISAPLSWEIYGTREKVCLPIGEVLSAKISAKVIWDAALAQTKLDAELNERLKKARPYFFCNIAILRQINSTQPSSSRPQNSSKNLPRCLPT